MYTKHFSLVEKPFEVSPDPRFLFPTPGNQELLSALIYGIRERKGFIVIVGDVGTGKTLMARAAMQRLDRDTKAAFLFMSSLTFKQLLSMALAEFDLAKPNERYTTVDAIHRLNEFAKKQMERGGNVVLIIDEAQNLSHKTMENLRTLTNIETSSQKMLQIVLVGQPELDKKLARYDWRQLVQRISVKRYSDPLSEKDTYKYIHHRLNIAEYNGPGLFTKKAMTLIWQATGGIPRMINILCDNALLIGYGVGKKTIDKEVVSEAINDLSWNQNQEDSALTPKSVINLANGQKRSRLRTLLVYAVSFFLLLLAATLGWLFLR